jgi:hypothetical protein
VCPRILLSLLLAAEPDAVERIGWLAGCWRAEGGEAGSGEHWMAPAGGTMLGLSRTITNGVTVAHESMQLRIVDGKLTFIALPSGQAETAFPLRSLDGESVVFEDPKHDFPQRVGYRRVSPDRVLAFIEGTRDGKTKRIEFPLTREPCEALAKPAPKK